MAQRRQRHIITPPLRRWLFVLCGTVACWTIFGCRSGLIIGDRVEANRLWNEGGDRMRTGFIATRIQPPLELDWTVKLLAAPTSSLLAVESHLICATKGGWITLLDPNSGKKNGILRIQKKVSLSCVSDGTFLFVGLRWEKPSLRAYDLGTLKTVWKIQIGPVRGEPLIVKNRIYTGTEPQMIYAVDTETGSIVWKRSLDGAPCGSPASKDRTVFIVTEEGSLWALDADDGMVVWRSDLDSRFLSGPVLSDRFLFIGSREGSCYGIDPDDGSMIWRYQSEGGVYEAAATDGEDVFFGTTRGLMVCLESTGGTQKWAFRSGSVIGTSPLVTDDMVFFGTMHRSLYGLDRTDGSVLFHTGLKGRVRTTPLVWQGKLLAASEDHYVYGFVEKR